jgi:hypothetical protein
MDVRIAFGVDLESVPDRVSDIIREINVHQINRLVDMACELIELSTDNVEMSVDLLEQARIKLAFLDKTLNDSQMILRGFINAKKEEPQNTHEEKVEKASPETSNAD